MGMAGLIFEPYPPNFKNQYNFWRCSNDAKKKSDFSTGFRFLKVSVECSCHIYSLSFINFRLFSRAYSQGFIYFYSFNFFVTEEILYCITAVSDQGS